MQSRRVLFENLELFADSTPLRAALNMALDEALLETVRVPLLRVYRWAGPSVSFGYFEPWEPVFAAYPGRDAVRRWTGGGVVPHGDDWTYSLIVPKAHPFATVKAAESYRVLHDHLACAIQVALTGAVALPGAVELSSKRAAKQGSRACFENPVEHDLLLETARAKQKIAGAAQRRSRFGLLHQGSVQGLKLPDDFAWQFAGRLASAFLPRRIPVQSLDRAEGLAESKYAAERWTRKV